MRLRALIFAAVTARAAVAHADPQLAWHAPDSCPGAEDARTRIERRLGEPIDRFTLDVDVAITSADRGYVARVADRTLTSETCDDLTDAVALVVARMATGSPRRTPASAVPQWGGGVRGSGLSGIGGVPSIGVGGELAAYVRRERWFGEVAAADWGQSTQHSHSEPGAAVGVGLVAASLRFGWAPEPKAIRTWLGADIGRMTNEDAALSGASPRSAVWIAIGPGFAVAWPIAPRVRLVGTMEVMAAVTHVRFVLQDGMEIYAPSEVSARTTLGLEVGWR